MPNRSEGPLLVPVQTPREALDRAHALLLAARGDLRPDSPKYKAAVVLLIAESARFNVERIARVAGYERSFVAKAARRLYDNGVWVDGATVRDWDDVELGPAFWSDVEVAEGHLYRRTSETGELEWGFPGSWWKAFDFGDTQGSSSAVRYLYAVEEEESEPSRTSKGEEEDPSHDDEASPERLWNSEPSWSLGFSPTGYRASNPIVMYGREAGRTAVGVGIAGAGGCNELFPDAVWLG